MRSRRNPGPCKRPLPLNLFTFLLKLLKIIIIDINIIMFPSYKSGFFTLSTKSQNSNSLLTKITIYIIIYLIYYYILYSGPSTKKYLDTALYVVFVIRYDMYNVPSLNYTFIYQTIIKMTDILHV